MSKKIEWHIEKRNLDQLNPYAHNPRKLTDKGMADLKRSIDKFGLAEPIIINLDNTIIGGHARYFTLLKMDAPPFVDCYVPNIELTPKEVQELNIRLNKNIAGEFDFDILAEAFKLDDLLEWGFEEKELDLSLWNDKTDEQLDDVPEPQKEAISKTGDLFLLDGKHRVMCGDSTKKEDVEKLMDNKKADMVFTDPPYNMIGGGRGCFHESTKNIKKRIEKIIDFNPEQISFIKDLNYPSYYFFASKDLLLQYLQIFKDYNFNLLIWAKSNPTPWTNNTFMPDIEYLMYFYKNDRIWNNSLKPTNVYSKYYLSAKLEGRKDSGDLHPTMKPVNLIMNKTKISSNTGGILLDLFLGSGSTLIACEQTNRICYGMEIDPIYIDVILKRYYNLYPEKKIECLTRNDFNFSDLFKSDAKN